ncbi:raucaffricine-o-beta-d-glucosidase [Phtheirospermum japonicum]|uniref:Raucaffricine-o-beta-d-glucosidase n=1 Tax=Phtheirospermum japonicum TaxID=374723 RepID=A0A830D1Y9_9LAMI|nr:raucaffricine-o-beta-d-glucosidase [Phtheirospermum japonicum]
MATERSLVIASPLTEKPGADGLGYLPPPPPPPPFTTSIRRTDFPDDFVFGTGTGAYQVEGAAAVGGKGPSVWDDFTLRTPGKITDGSNGNIACDMYHRYKEDIRTMKNMGFDAYRFSISWPRILPGGRASAGINREGIDYYNDLIDTVRDNDMEPYVTLFHWDTPACLEKEYGGFLSKNILDDFREYVELCFWEFGDRVKWWTTINEPWTYAVHGYVRGIFPPAKTSGTPARLSKNLPAHRSDQHTVHLTNQTTSNATYDKLDPAKDAYTVARNLLLAHAVAVDSYRRKFKDIQNGEIGIVLNSHWHVPFDACSKDDMDASYRAVDFMLGWFLEPILNGDYPESMHENVPQDNLASFSKSEWCMLRGSVDFLGLNYYTTNYAKNDPCVIGEGYDVDQKIEYLYTNRQGKPIGNPSGSTWLYIVPLGIYEHLKYLADKYSNLPPIYITENGVSEKNDFKLTAKDACVDYTRIKYHQDHLAYIKRAMFESSRGCFKNKLNVKGYFVWSWCDNFEWKEGYTARFGITYIDYMNNQTRYPKNSALWFAKFLKAPKKNPRSEHSSKKRQNEDDNPENGPTEKRARDNNGEEE